jgi:cell division protein FtsZ
MTLFEVDEAANRIREEVDSDANIIFGSTFDDALKGRMRVSVVATGINVDAAHQRPPRPALTVVAQGQRMQAQPRAVVAAMAQPITLGQTALAREPMVQAAPAIAAAPAPTLAPAPAAVAMAAIEPRIETRAEPQPIMAMAEPVAELEPIEAAAAAVEPAAAEPIRGEPIRAEPIRAEPARLEPAPVSRPTQPFIAPRPAAATARSEAAEPDPFAAAAMANGSRDKARAPTLFQRVVGIGRSQPTTEPLLREPAAQRAAAPKPAQPAKPAAPAQPRLGHLDPSERLGTSAEDDLLDIPAFLRRQAN